MTHKLRPYENFFKFEIYFQSMHFYVLSRGKGKGVTVTLLTFFLSFTYSNKLNVNPTFDFIIDIILAIILFSMTFFVKS